MKSAILKTLAYADIFAFPLAQAEIWSLLIWKNLKKPSKKEFNKILQTLLKNKTIKEKQGYFYLNNREKLVKKRQELNNINQDKLKLAKKFATKIKFIPFIKTILITGALAVKNAQPEDDIDLFIITSNKRLWLTRFLCILIAELFGIRRRPNQKYIKNKICLNLFLTEDNLNIFQKNQNLFTAHEIVQAKPILNKDKTYQQFLNANLWVKNYLPNSIKTQSAKLKTQNHNLNFKTKKSYLLSTIYYLLNSLEHFAYKLQFVYMSPKKTIEKVSPTFAFFHPINRRKRILTYYTRKIHTLGV